jgi:Leucine-rich repeat (LRR) protein
MSLFNRFLIVPVILWTLLSGAVFARTVITFPKGTGLERCVRDNLFQPFLSPIYEEDALTLTALSCDGDNITSLDGIEAFINLQSVDFGYKPTSIDNITPLASLGKLTTLRITKSNITDISPLAALKLTNLDLSDNHIADLTPLSEMTSLSTLVLYRQPPDYITDITPLDNLTHITLLDLEANKITDIEPLRNMKGLRYLHLKDNRLASITPLEELGNLELVNVSLNALTDISPLMTSTGITALYADSNRITSLDFLSALPKITHISLNRNRISDITPVDNLTYPDYLSFDMNLITDIEILRTPMTLRRIGTLSLAYNCVESFDTFPIYFVKETRLSHQCEPHPAPSAFDLATTVNGDLLEAGAGAEIDEELMEKAEPTGPGGCSLAKDADILIILGPLIIMLTILRSNISRRRVK